MWSTFTLVKRHCRSPVLGQWNNRFLTHCLDDPVLYLSLCNKDELSLYLFFAKMKERAESRQKIKRRKPKWPFHKRAHGTSWSDKTKFSTFKILENFDFPWVFLLPLSVTFYCFFVEVEVIQIHCLILQVQSDQHEPELLGSPCSFYCSCSSPLIPDQYSKGICHCPSFVHLSIYALYPLKKEKTEVGSLFLSQFLKNVLSTSQIPVSTSEMYWKVTKLRKMGLLSSLKV